MEFVLQPRSPARSFAGLAIVTGLHIAIVLGLMYGLARNHVKFNLPAPIDWVSIVDTPPPLPRLPMQAARQSVPVITPQEMVLDIPLPVADTLAPPATDAPPVPDGNPVAGRPITGAGAAASASLGVACPNAQAIRSTMRYPAQARRDSLQGDVLAQFVVGADGDIRDLRILSSSNRAFNGAVMSALMQFSCIGQGRDVSVEVPFSFRLE